MIDYGTYALLEWERTTLIVNGCLNYTYYGLSRYTNKIAQLREQKAI